VARAGGASIGFRCALVAVTLLCAWTLLDGWSHLHWIGQKSTAAVLALAGLATALSAAALARGWSAPAPPGGAAAAWRLALLLAGATWMAFLLLVDPYREYALALAASAAASLWAVLAVARRRGARWPRVALEAERAGARIVLAVVAVELLLALIASRWPNAALAGSSAQAHSLVEANRAPAGSFSFGFPCDARGHYDHPPPPPPREGRLVVSIGDSFSASVVPHHFHYTTAAERELAALRGPGEPPVEIYNMGLPGLGPPEYLHLLVHEALPLRPDLIVVHLFAGNDLEARNLVKPGLARRWFDPSELLLVRVPVRIVRLLEERRALRREGAPKRAHWHRGEQRRLETLEEVIAEHPWVVDPLREDAMQSVDSFQRTQAYRASNGCRPEQRFEAFFPWIEEIVRAAGRIPVVFALIPDEYQVNDEVWRLALEYVAEARDLGGAERLVRDHVQRVLVPEFERRGWPLLDYLPILRAAEPLADGALHVYHLRDTHWNARGNHIAGVALARFLLPRL
jgi:hypothetical protein